MYWKYTQHSFRKLILFLLKIVLIKLNILEAVYLLVFFSVKRTKIFFRSNRSKNSFCDMFFISNNVFCCGLKTIINDLVPDNLSWSNDQQILNDFQWPPNDPALKAKISLFCSDKFQVIKQHLYIVIIQVHIIIMFHFPHYK